MDSTLSKIKEKKHRNIKKISTEKEIPIKNKITKNAEKIEKYEKCE